MKNKCFLEKNIEILSTEYSIISICKLIGLFFFFLPGENWTGTFAY